MAEHAKRRRVHAAAKARVAIEALLAQQPTVQIATACESHMSSVASRKTRV